MKVYTRTGDDGTTGLYYGGRVAKSDGPIVVNGAVDEAQAALGWARTQVEPGGDVDELLVTVERDLWVLMAEVATAEANRAKLVDGTSRVTAAMVEHLEAEIDAREGDAGDLRDFVVPGDTAASAALDVARTAVRRAEREAVAFGLAGSLVATYLNRLSDLVWTLARAAEGPRHRLARPTD